MAIVLARPGHALDEDVAAGEQRDDQPLEQVVLADDDLLDLVQQLLHRGGALSGVWLVHGQRLLSTAAGRRRRRRRRWGRRGRCR